MLLPWALTWKNKLDHGWRRPCVCWCSAECAKLSAMTSNLGQDWEKPATWGLTSMWAPTSKPAFLQLLSTTTGTSLSQTLAFLTQEVPHTPRIVPQTYFLRDRAEKLGPCSSLSLSGIHSLRNFGPLVFPKASYTLSGSICLHKTEWLIPLFVKHSQRNCCQ